MYRGQHPFKQAGQGREVIETTPEEEEMLARHMQELTVKDGTAQQLSAGY
jgi:hypothetical protein